MFDFYDNPLGEIKYTAEPCDYGNKVTVCADSNLTKKHGKYPKGERVRAILGTFYRSDIDKVIKALEGAK